MKCGFCNFEFDQSRADTTCNGCPLMKGCHLVCCPRCGYEMPPEAKLVVWLRELSRRSKKQLPVEESAHECK